jgi:hypothetical protein
MTARHYLGFLALHAGACLMACGGGGSSPTTPSTPSPTPTPTPVATTPSPTPSPSPTPCTTGLCEDPTTNTAPPERVILRFYQLFNEKGEWVLPTPDPYKQKVREPIPLGFTIRLDVTGKDADGQPTNGKEDIAWLYSDDGMIEEASQGPFQRKVKVLKPGKWELYVVFDGTPSNSLGFTFCDPAADPACKYP